MHFPAHGKFHIRLPETKPDITHEYILYNDAIPSAADDEPLRARVCFLFGTIQAPRGIFHHFRRAAFARKTYPYRGAGQPFAPEMQRLVALQDHVIGEDGREPQIEQQMSDHGLLFLRWSSSNCIQYHSCLGRWNGPLNRFPLAGWATPPSRWR